MSLDDYALLGVSTNLEPVFGARLLRLLDHFGGRVRISSGYRSREQQQRLYDLYLAGGNLAAKPGLSEHEFGRAADLDRHDPELTWGEVHYTAAAYGLKFPIPSENWHTQADPAFIDPPAPPPEEPDMQWRILAPAGSAAKFIAPMAPLPDGTLAALYATWLSDGNKVQAYLDHGVEFLGLAVEDLRNVTLLGPLPTGDAREWTAADWLTVA